MGFCAPAEAGLLGAGGERGGGVWEVVGVAFGFWGVCCEEEKRELMLFIHEGLLDWRGSSLVALSVLERLSRLGRLLACALLWGVEDGGVGVIGTAGSVSCLGCDSDGGVTGAGAGFLVVSLEGWTFCVCGGSSPFAATGGLFSFEVEDVEEACLRCWFSVSGSARCMRSDRAAHARRRRWWSCDRRRAGLPLFGV